jgi:hypothetical protein
VGGVEGERVRRELVALRVKEQDALRRRFERAKSEGDPPNYADAAAVAQFVTAIYQGMTGNCAEINSALRFLPGLASERGHPDRRPSKA